MKHIEGGKNFGDKFLSTFPSASKPFSLRQLFQPARLACHDILRYARIGEWALLRFPSLWCRWFPPPLAILGAPQIHLTSYLALGWKKIIKSLHFFFWDALYRVLHKCISIYISRTLSLLRMEFTWKLFTWNNELWHFRFILLQNFNCIKENCYLQNFNILLSVKYKQDNRRSNCNICFY